MKIAILLLAAGSSSRMGSPKQLLPWGEATLLEHAMNIASSSKADRLVLVLGAGEKEIRSALGDRPVELVVNRQWHSGLGSSISAGMDFLMSDAQPPDAVLLMLADQPLLDREFLNRLIRHFQDGDGEIVCTDYGSKKGTPAIFHNKFFSALARLSGEEGAGGLIAAYPASVYSLEGGRRIFDLDTPADFHKLKQIQSKSDL